MVRSRMTYLGTVRCTTDHGRYVLPVWLYLLRYRTMAVLRYILGRLGTAGARDARAKTKEF
jgi:hypothetical protein